MVTVIEVVIVIGANLVMISASQQLRTDSLTATIFACILFIKLQKNYQHPQPTTELLSPTCLSLIWRKLPTSTTTHRLPATDHFRLHTFYRAAKKLKAHPQPSTALFNAIWMDTVKPVLHDPDHHLFHIIHRHLF